MYVFLSLTGLRRGLYHAAHAAQHLQEHGDSRSYDLFSGRVKDVVDCHDFWDYCHVSDGLLDFEISLKESCQLL